MIDEYSHVTIKETGVTGIVVDVSTSYEKTVYTVESDNPNEGYYERFLCTESELTED